MKAARWLFVGLATVVAIVLSLGFAIVVGLWFMYGWRVDNGWVLLAICSFVNLIPMSTIAFEFAPNQSSCP